ncbi:hypothetical protein IWQ57_003839 [Coemansia nantahalensis]|uniref:Uncharacterized protein n=1 Tax=Coemansia nantahalensis TaxID=2789366 RepID=A0ACC1JV45_9FUNG|nr:hypothetical protein IWQ57_003839 [Coemansia nantahalensis]
MPMLAPVPPALRAHEDADDIDDILCNLWPTSRAECAPTPACPRPPPAPHGQRTPPADAAPAYAPPYALDAPPAPPPRLVSAAIQIGDPEWRVDSASVSAECPDLPSPVSPTMPCAPAAGATPREPALGLASAARPPPSLRRATLGLLRSAAPFSKPAGGARPAPRAMTPEERVARLHSVSGLAARAVARRCLSGQIPARDADALHRPRPPPLLLPPATQPKPTFADVARGSPE